METLDNNIGAHGHHAHHNHEHHNHEQKIKAVVVISALIMVLEIGYGYYTNSMALLADGWHMASHVFAIGLSWIAYYYARIHKSNKNFVSGTGKILALSGYTSAIVLQVVAIIMAIESFVRLIHPVEIIFKDAIVVAIIGLFVNAISAFFLHHDHEHSDHNIKAAYIHVLSDMLTSIAAIAALIVGYYWNIYEVDAAAGILSSIVITKWSVDLIRNSAKELMDYK